MEHLQDAVVIQKVVLKGVDAFTMQQLNRDSGDPGGLRSHLIQRLARILNGLEAARHP